MSSSDKQQDYSITYQTIVQLLAPWQLFSYVVWQLNCLNLYDFCIVTATVVVVVVLI